MKASEETRHPPHSPSPTRRCHSAPIYHTNSFLSLQEKSQEESYYAIPPFLAARLKKPRVSRNMGPSKISHWLIPTLEQSTEESVTYWTMSHNLILHATQPEPQHRHQSAIEKVSDTQTCVCRTLLRREYLRSSGKGPKHIRGHLNPGQLRIS